MCVKRINITIEENILKEFDGYCEDKHYKRSNKIEELMRTLLNREGIYFTRKLTREERESWAEEVKDL